MEQLQHFTKIGPLQITPLHPPPTHTYIEIRTNIVQNNRMVLHIHVCNNHLLLQDRILLEFYMSSKIYVSLQHTAIA